MPDGLSLSSLHKRFADHAVLDGVDLHVEPGEFVSLLGPSGCGKSTLLRIVAGLEPQTAGSVHIGGRAVDGLRPSERDVAMVFQNYALYPHLSVRDNIAMPLTMRRLSPWQRQPLLGRWFRGQRQAVDRIHVEVETLASSLGLEHLLGRKPGQLSGGQRQRVALARAMVRRPAVFLMDEPLSNLDATLRVQVRDELADLHRRLGATFVYVTHDQGEAMSLSSRVAVMQAGRILQVASPRELYERPASLGVARFVGQPAINELVLSSVLGECWLAADWPVRLLNRSGGGGVCTAGTAAIRAEQLSLAIGDASFEQAMDAGIQAHVVRAEHQGADWLVEVQVDRWQARLSIRVAQRRWPAGVSAGCRVRVGWRWEDFLVFDANGTLTDLRVVGHPSAHRTLAGRW